MSCAIYNDVDVMREGDGRKEGRDSGVVTYQAKSMEGDGKVNKGGKKGKGDREEDRKEGLQRRTTNKTIKGNELHPVEDKEEEACTVRLLPDVPVPRAMTEAVLAPLKAPRLTMMARYCP